MTFLKFVFLVELTKDEIDVATSLKLSRFR